MLKALEILYAERRDINESIRNLPYLSNNKNHLKKNLKFVEDATAEIEELQKNLQELILYSKVDNERTACEIMDDLQPYLEKIEKFCK